MGNFVALIIFLLSLGGAESFLKHLRSRRIQLRETNHKLLKLIVGDGAATVGLGIYVLSLIYTTNKEKNDEAKKLLVDAQATNNEKNGKSERLPVDAQATNNEKNDELLKLFVDVQATATRDMREHKLATANALEKICTAMQTANALMVKDIDKLSGKT